MPGHDGHGHGSTRTGLAPPPRRLRDGGDRRGRTGALRALAAHALDVDARRVVVADLGPRRAPSLPRYARWLVVEALPGAVADSVRAGGQVRRARAVARGRARGMPACDGAGVSPWAPLRRLAGG